MKWCIVITLAFLCCTAQEFQITIAPLPKPVNITNTRIIGGVDSSIERFPYIVQVQFRNSLACGGSLITQRHVLSAAHCFFDQQGLPVAASLFSVRAGSTLLQSGGKVYSVSSYILHPLYNTPVRDNDVAIMMLGSAVTLGASVAIASIPMQGDEVPDNSTVIHVGWGATNVNIAVPAPVLQEVQIRTISFDICFRQYAWLQQITGDPYPVTSNMLCSGLFGIGGKDACQGDSGGPLVYQNVVVGVTSWGYGCAEPLFPGVNAKVSAYTNWINHTVVMGRGTGPVSSSISASLVMISVIYSMLAMR